MKFFDKQHWQLKLNDSCCTVNHAPPLRRIYITDPHHRFTPLIKLKINLLTVNSLKRWIVQNDTTTDVSFIRCALFSLLSFVTRNSTPQREALRMSCLKGVQCLHKNVRIFKPCNQVLCWTFLNNVPIVSHYILYTIIKCLCSVWTPFQIDRIRCTFIAKFSSRLTKQNPNAP